METRSKKRTNMEAGKKASNTNGSTNWFETKTIPIDSIYIDLTWASMVDNSHPDSTKSGEEGSKKKKSKRKRSGEENKQTLEKPFNGYEPPQLIKGGPNGINEDSEVGKKCLLFVKNCKGEMVEAAAGEVLEIPDDFHLHEDYEYVIVRYPICLPLAPLPIHNPDAKDVGAAVGCKMPWPVELIATDED